MTADKIRVEQKGGGQKEAKIERALEQNVNAVGDKIFWSHITNIFTQALLQKYDILDCLVAIDLVAAPPTVEVILASLLPSDDVAGKYHIDGARTQRLVYQNRHESALTVLVRAFGKATLMAVPGMNAPLGSWREAQAVASRAQEDEIASLRRNPDELERQLQDLRLAKSSLIGADRW